MPKCVSDRICKVTPIRRLRGERLREVDVMTVKGKEKDIGILELLWQDSADLTSMAPRPKRKASRLALRHGERV